METRDFWRPTTTAAARMAALGIHPERREPPYARMYYGGTDLPDEFVVLYPGTPACETVIGPCHRAGRRCHGQGSSARS
jgi:hypothetical protein